MFPIGASLAGLCAAWAELPGFRHMPENEGQKFGDAFFDDVPAFVFLHFRAHEGKFFAAVGKLYPCGVGQRRKAREVRVLRVVAAHIEVAGELEAGQTVR